MFDTMTMTKVVGAFCGALLVYLLGAWVGEALYHSGHGHSEQAYVIDTGEEETAEGAEGAAEAEPAAPVDMVSLVASADASSGQGVFRQCQACHNAAEEQNGVGPHLVGVMGRAIGSVDGFGYSGALPDGEWGVENMSAWIKAPREFAPGTSMGYAGLDDDEDRADLIAYLIQQSPGYEMPAPQEEEAAAPADAAPTEEGATEEAAVEEAQAEEAAAQDTATEDGTEMAAAEGASETVSEGAAASPIQAAFETADAAAGEQVWRQCQACHVADQEQNRVGPHLVDIIGREIGSVEGFRYSGALPEGEWTLEELNKWLENPREYAQGTSMGYAGLDDIEDRANLLAYLDSL